MDFPAPDTPIKTIINKPLYAAISYLSDSSDSSSMIPGYRLRIDRCLLAKGWLIPKIRSIGAKLCIRHGPLD